jgi:ABC-2 type transport system ATP-binding protein
MARRGRSSTRLAGSSHLLAEVEQRVDGLIVINEGRCVYQGELPDGRLAVAGTDAPRVGDVALAAGVAVHGLVEERMDLERMFLHLVADGRR